MPALGSLFRIDPSSVSTRKAVDTTTRALRLMSQHPDRFEITVRQRLPVNSNFRAPLGEIPRNHVLHSLFHQDSGMLRRGIRVVPAQSCEQVGLADRFCQQFSKPAGEGFFRGVREGVRRQSQYGCGSCARLSPSQTAGSRG